MRAGGQSLVVPDTGNGSPLVRELVRTSPVMPFVYQEIAISVSVGDNQTCAASRRDSNWADASKRSVFLSHQD